MNSSTIHPVAKKTFSSVVLEWDAIAAARDEEIRSGRDLSYHHVLVPTVLSLAKSSTNTRILDVGCGTGYLSSLLQTDANKVTAIDPSSNSIKIAKSHLTRNRSIEYVVSSIEDYTKIYKGEKFSLAVANMVLQDVHELDSCLAAIASLIKYSGSLIITITHPNFWPKYWNYDSKPWFSYLEEIAIEAPFKTSLNQEGHGVTTHFHRPLQQYFSSLLANGFLIDTVLEPYPPNDIMKQYPQPWSYPRFLAIKLLKN
jgi:2-polyprenyl-3-methyl-5-hydroxy-6-metoxy-1,4-benzoquinol methylase